MSKRAGRRGHSVIELTLLLPWFLFLFVGAFDWGFFAWALISTENAARVAATYTSSNTGTVADSSGACAFAMAQLAYAPNVGSNPGINSTNGIGSGSSACTGSPVTVTASSVTGPDGSPASQVSVTYRTPVLVPIPGLLSGQVNITRVVQMRVRS